MKRALSVFAIVMLALLGFAAPASAGGDSDPTIDGSQLDGVARAAAAAGPCGSSYRHIGHYPVGSSPVLGYMDVYWSSTAKRNCMVTNHTGATYGVRLYTEAAIRVNGSSSWGCPRSVGCDGDFYRYYAGPVYTPAGVDMSNRCIDIKGVVDWAQASRTRIHCG
jgi:hypothetical protein